MDEGDDRLAFVVCLDDAAGTDAGDDRNGDAARCRNGERSVARDGPEDGEPTPVGLVHAYGIGTERAHLAYWLVPDYHGEGYGREAAALLVDRAFRATPVHSVGAGAFAFNDASRSILESLGFTEEYRRREAEYVEGAYRDFVQYGLLRREWRER
jgi:RimJ/RimL family protein N-acetyltransferase